MIRGGLVELPVARLATAVRFYVETLGVKLVESRGGPGEAPCAVLDLGEGFLVALVEAAADAPRVVLGLRVDDVGRAVALLENRGIVFRSEAHASTAVSAFSDGDGNTLFLFAA